MLSRNKISEIIIFIRFINYENSFIGLYTHTHTHLQWVFIVTVNYAKWISLVK